MGGLRAEASYLFLPGSCLYTNLSELLHESAFVVNRQT